MQEQSRPPAASSILARIRNYDWTTYRELFTPKLVTTLRAGYTLETLRHDAVAGLTVAILAIPLSMAIAIGAGATPGSGLVTAIVAGFLISALGGSRFQIGGPAAAFIVIVASVAAEHGQGGLMTATFLAGFVLIVAGFLKLGTYIKYIPGPVVIGFTTGIGILIGLGQLKDFLGLAGDIPVEVVARVKALWAALGTFNIAAFLVGVATLAGIVGLKHWRPKWPGLLIAVAVASAAVWVLGLDVETIGSRFGGIPSSLPVPALPDLSPAKVREVFSASLTIAFLVGVESLLSAVAADAMASTRHRSNMEIVAQGAANLASPLFGGLPATGVIARTGTSILAGARTPVAGILHSLFVLIFVLFLSPLASYLALPCLAAVLLNTSWRLIDLGHVSRFASRAPWDDRIVLAATLLLTVLVDLSVAIAVGVVLASMLFMHRMAETPGLKLAGQRILLDDVVDESAPQPAQLMEEVPEGVRVFSFSGPLFFGAASRLGVIVNGLGTWPEVLILRMREVPLVDATGVDALEELVKLAAQHGTRVIMSGLAEQPREALHRFGFVRRHRVLLADSTLAALKKAKSIQAKRRRG